MPTVVCQNPTCAMPFRIFASFIKYGGGKYCSRPCYHAHRRLKVLDNSDDFVHRFWSKVKKTETCWYWIGTQSPHGHGIIGRVTEARGKHNEMAHRIAWELLYGSIPQGMYVLHQCPGEDNPACVNPQHLFLGGHEEKKGKQTKSSLLERFQEKIDKTTTCWLWLGTTNNRGYGVLGVGRSHKLAHRIAYSLAYGSLPDALLVLHRCDTPRCVNPEHLFLGTHKDNTQDALKKGRLLQGEMSRFESTNTTHDLPKQETISMEIIYNRDKGICSLCHKRVKRNEATFEHIIPRSLGGVDTYQNIVLAHQRCNSRKGNRPVTQQMRLF